MSEVCFQNGLCFGELNMIPRDDSVGPVMHYTEEIKYPKAYEVTGEGVVKFHLYIPGAHQVSLRTFTDEFELEMKDGLWTREYPVGTGFIGIFLKVDGMDFLYPGLPIGFGGNRPINFIEVLEPDAVIAPGDCPHGTVLMDYINSRVSGRMERIYIYLPPDYHDNTDKKYPILYLQHGHGENETTWVNQGKANFIYDNLIAEKKAEPSIVVMCNGMVSFEKNGEVFVSAAEKFEELLVTEVIPYVEKKYRTFGDKAHRAMAGLSMGSMQTSVVTLKHQDLFAYAGIFSGFVTDFLSGHKEHVKPEYLCTYSKNLTYIFRAMGDQDIFMERFLEDDKLLEKYGVEHERVIYEGFHEWKVWQHCLADFIQKIFRDEQI